MLHTYTKRARYALSDSYVAQVWVYWSSLSHNKYPPCAIHHLNTPSSLYVTYITQVWVTAATITQDLPLTTNQTNSIIQSHCKVTLLYSGTSGIVHSYYIADCCCGHKVEGLNRALDIM